MKHMKLKTLLYEVLNEKRKPFTPDEIRQFKALEDEMKETFDGMLDDHPRFKGFKSKVNYHPYECHEHCPMGFDLDINVSNNLITLDTYDEDPDDPHWFHINGGPWWDAVIDELNGIEVK